MVSADAKVESVATAATTKYLENVMGFLTKRGDATGFVTAKLSRPVAALTSEPFGLLRLPWFIKSTKFQALIHRPDPLVLIFE
jgi:hypothetical protein